MLSVSSDQFSQSFNHPHFSSIPPISSISSEGRLDIDKLSEQLKTLLPKKPKLCLKLLRIFDGNRVNFYTAGITAKELMSLDDKTWEVLSSFVQQQKEAVTEIYLPDGLNDFPSNLHKLLINGELQYLSAPGYTGDFLNLFDCGIKQCANLNVDFAAKLKEVRVPEGCVVRGKSDFDHKDKIVVQHFTVEDNGDATFEKKSLVYGHSYAQGTGIGKAGWETKLTSLNCKAQFQPPLLGKEPGSEENQIVCRQLSLDWIYERRAYLLAMQNSAKQEKQEKQEKHDIYRERYGSVEQIQQSVPASREQDYLDWAKRSPGRHVVRPLAQWGKFLDERFKKMKEGDFCHFLIESGEHCMAVELVLTKDKRREVRFFDPNTTQTHVRTVEEAEESLEHLSFSEMLLGGREYAEDYFGSLPDRVWFHAIPITGNHPPPSLKNLSGRSLDVGPLTVQNVDSSVIRIMAKYGFAKKLKKILQEILKDPLAHNKLEDFLVEKREDDVSPALFFALQEGRTRVVKAIIDAILASRLSKKQKMALLAAKDERGVRGLSLAMGRGHAGAVKAMVEAIFALTLSVKQKMALLAAKSSSGVPGLYMALQEGQTKIVKAMVEAILASNLSAEQKMELLVAKSDSGASGLYIALQYGHAETVKTMVRLILASNLSADQQMELLEAKSSVGVPGIYMALQEGHTEAVKIMFEAILQSRRLTPRQKRVLLEGWFYDQPALNRAMENGHVETVKVAIEAILASSALSAQQKVTLLEGKRENGNSGNSMLYDALMNDQKEMVEMIVDAVMNSTLSPEQKIQLLVGMDEDRMAIHWAIHNGYVKTVRTMTEAVLDSELSKDKKRKLLARKNAGGESALDLQAESWGQNAARGAFIKTIKEHGWGVTAKNKIVFSAGR